MTGLVSRGRVSVEGVALGNDGSVKAAIWFPFMIFDATLSAIVPVDAIESMTSSNNSTIIGEVDSRC